MSTAALGAGTRSTRPRPDPQTRPPSSRGGVCFTHRRGEGNRAILEFSGCHWRPGGGEGEEGEQRLERGLGLGIHSRPPSLARERWGKVEPEDTEPESPRPAAPPAHGTPRTPRPPPPHKCRINSDIQGLKGRAEWLSRISPSYVDGRHRARSILSNPLNPPSASETGGGGKEEEDHDKDEIWQRVPRLCCSPFAWSACCCRWWCMFFIIIIIIIHEHLLSAYCVQGTVLGVGAGAGEERVRGFTNR